ASMDVSDADVEEAADVIRVGRRPEGHRRLVIGGWPADVDDDPTVSERHNRGLPLAQYLAPEHVGVEAPRSFDVRSDEEVREQHSSFRRWERGHRERPPIPRTATVPPTRAPGIGAATATAASRSVAS